MSQNNEGNQYRFFFCQVDGETTKESSVFLRTVALFTREDPTQLSHL